MRKFAFKHGLTKKLRDHEMVYSEIAFGDHKLRFADGSRVTRKRVETLFEKEPVTMTWIESFAPSDILLDIGANVGMYSVYTAAVMGCQVFSIEPESTNFANLNKNILLNGLDRKVKAFCCAASTKFSMDTLYLSSHCPGFSHHDFGENSWRGPVTQLAKSPESRPQQGCISISIDEAIAAGYIPQPTHIKVDVDGFENRVIEGAWKTIDDPRLQSILIETDFSIDTSTALIKQMQDRGWFYSDDQVRTSRDGVVSMDKWNARLESKKGGCNIIYFRDKKRSELPWLDRVVDPSPPKVTA